MGGGTHTFQPITEEILILKISRGESVFFKGVPGRSIHALVYVQLKFSSVSHYKRKREDTKLGEVREVGVDLGELG